MFDILINWRIVAIAIALVIVGYRIEERGVLEEDKKNNLMQPSKRNQEEEWGGGEGNLE